MRLVISEKPSVAKALAQALGVQGHRKGYFQGNGYCITWCFGHLAELAPPSYYKPEWRHWSLNTLPMLPEHMKWLVCQDKQEQVRIIKELLSRDDITEVINACDSGREGELIFRNVYSLTGCKAPMKRLWISSMETTAIKQGFRELKDGSQYDGLYQSALARAEADWIVGINASRFFSLQYDQTLKVGRVVSPTLAFLTSREEEIKSFTSEPFYTVQLNCGFPVSSERFRDKAAAEAAANACRGNNAVIAKVEEKEKSEKPPTLYDLTTLQRDANRLLGLSAQQTLDCLQSLYEKQLTSYPRTDSKYLTDDMAKMVPELVNIASTICALPVHEKANASQVCNSAHVTDHYALVPTPTAGKVTLSALAPNEQELLKLICRRLICAVSQPCRVAETKITVVCGDLQLGAKGKTILTPGWKRYKPTQEEAPAVLPKAVQGQHLPVESVSVKTGMTTPPKYYSEDTLLGAMETAGSKDAERRGLGTPATRAGIIEKLISGGFAERKKDGKITHLCPTDKGIALAAILPEALKSPDLTAEWEAKLKDVEQGRLTPADFHAGITDLLYGLFQYYTPDPNAAFLFPPNYEIVGTCPRCGGQVADKKQAFFCLNKDCKFALWKQSKFFDALQKEITPGIAAALLKDRQVPMRGCLSRKTGKHFDSILFLEDDGERTTFRLEFQDKKKKKKH